MAFLVADTNISAIDGLVVDTDNQNFQNFEILFSKTSKIRIYELKFSNSSNFNVFQFFTYSD